MQRNFWLPAFLAITAMTILHCVTIKGDSHMNNHTDNFSEQWDKIDSLRDERLPQSALAMTLDLRLQALKSENWSHYIKALMYINVLKQEPADWSLSNIISNLEEEVESVPSPAKSILYSYLGELTASYVRQNYWLIGDRADGSEDDLETMSINQLHRKANLYYLESIKDSTLDNVPLSEYGVLIEKDSQYYRYWTTLYDLLAYRAITHLTSPDLRRQSTFQSHGIYAIDFFYPQEDFVKIELDPKETSDMSYQALRLLQSVLSKMQADPMMIEIDLLRLEYVWNNSIRPDKDQLYIKALERLIGRFVDLPQVTLVHNKLAEFYWQVPIDQDTLAWQKAHRICSQALQNHPHSRGAVACHSLQERIEQKSLQVQLEEVTLPGQSQLMRIDFRNVDTVYHRLVRFSEFERKDWVHSSPEEQIGMLNRHASLIEEVIQLPKSTDFRNHSTEWIIEELKPGFYVSVVSTDAQMDKEGHAIIPTPFFVSRLSCLHAQSPVSQDFTVVDREKGSPLMGVRADWFALRYDRQGSQPHYQQISTGTSGPDGKLKFPGAHQRGLILKMTQGDDWIVIDRQFHDIYQQPDPGKQVRVEFITDRAIYRPGQIVHFKGLVIESESSGDPRIIKYREVRISLFDANGQLVQELPLVSSKFGSVSGSFTLPTSGLRGQMWLGCDLSQQRHAFQVEEYRRPQFEVKIEQPKQANILGDSIEIIGSVMSYAGAALSHMPIQFKVSRQVQWPQWPWYRHRNSMPQSIPKEVTVGSATTDHDGKFTFHFPASSDPKHSQTDDFLSYIFRVEVTAVDLNGESQSATSQIKVGNKPIYLRFSTPRLNRIDKIDTILFSAMTTNDQPIPIEGTLRLEVLQGPERFVPRRYWPMPDQPILPPKQFASKNLPFLPQETSVEDYPVKSELTTIRFMGNGQVKVPLEGLDLAPGYYRATAIGKEPKGREVIESTYFMIYDLGESFVPGEDLLSLSLSQDSYQPGDTAMIDIGNATGGAVRYQIIRRQGKVEAGWLNSQRGWEILPIPIGHDDHGGVTVSLAKIAENRLEVKTISLSVPRVQKELKVNFETMREQWRPAEEQKVTITISDNGGLPRAAEVAATMFDASLEAFIKHDWNVSFYRDGYLYGHQSSYSFGIRYGSLWAKDWNTRTRYSRIEHPQLKSFGLMPKPSAHRSYARDQAMMEDEVMNTSLEGEESAKPRKQLDAASNAQTKPPEIRSDFAETVFFYPHLESDSNGNVQFSFTTNDALTRWKLMAFAHTEDLAYGQASHEIVTAKELMVTPNLPRFIRNGDLVKVTAKVDNLTTEPILGSAVIEFRELGSGQVRSDLVIDPVNVPIDIPAQGSDVVQWQFQVPDDLNRPLEYVIKAVGLVHQDAVSGILPVLKREILVTETKAWQVRGEDTSAFIFKPLVEHSSPTLRHVRYTLDYASSPVWYVIKALPYLKSYPHQSTEQIFNRYYANTVGAHLVNSIPELQTIFEEWQRSHGLESPLSQNQELKSALLHETPWMSDAEDEKAQRSEIALFFEENNLQQELSNSIHKLKEIQLPNGGFPWFPGGLPNTYITQYLVTGFANLHQLDSRYIDTQILGGALNFIHDRARSRYSSLIAREASSVDPEKDYLSPLWVQYLYVGKLFSKLPLPSENEQLYRFMLDQARNHWQDRSLYEQALLALVFSREGDSVMVDRLLRSFNERAIRDPENGMRWNYDSGQLWHQLSIETHTQMIQVYDQLTKDRNAVSDLCVWLLSQKRTRHWPTTKSTAAAIHAILSAVPGWKSAKAIELKVGGEKVENLALESGTLHGTTSYPVDDLSKKLAQVEIKNPNEGPAWGAVYWQYFEQIDKVDATTKSYLSIEKKMILETYNNGHSEYQPIESGHLSPGDRVLVQLTIDVDRDMEFVHLSDQRAAGFEPELAVSRHYFKHGLGYYLTTGDFSTDFFIEYLPKGKYTLEYSLRVNQRGEFAGGISTIQSMYAPEYRAHSGSRRIVIDPEG